MNKPILIFAAVIMCAMMAVSSYAAKVHGKPVHKGAPEKTATADFNVRKDALAQHIKDTIFRLSIEKSCVKAATTAAALEACQHDAPAENAMAMAMATDKNSKMQPQTEAQTTQTASSAPAKASAEKTPAKK